MYKYVHGGDVYSHKLTSGGKAFIDFSANINPLGLPLGVRNAVKKAIKQCINYPDPFCRELREALAKFLKVKEEYIFFGNGASDVLFRLVLTLKPRRALLLAPTFADYERALNTVDCKIGYYKLSAANGFKVEENVLKQITARTDMVVICNPNNPTGQITDKKILEAIIEKCASVKAYLLIDECFMDFVDKNKEYTMCGELKKYSNLIILKAFTKIFAMPGLRLGYCLCADNDLQGKLYENGQDWSVSVLAQEAGKAALKEPVYLHESSFVVKEERKYLITQLKLLGAEIYGSKANYIFFRLEHPKNLVELLQEQGYLIRSCANYRNLGNDFYRIAVKTRVLNRSLIKAMKEARKHAIFTGTY